LRAEPIWATAQRGGKKIIVSHIPTFAEERAEQVVRFSGYDLIAGRDGIVTKRAVQSESTQPWDNPPPSDAAPIEISFKIGESHFVGVLIDDPADPQIGYDTMVSHWRNGNDVSSFKTSEPEHQRRAFLERADERQNSQRPRSQELFPSVRPQTRRQ
jgi:hypothetical protein